MSQLYHEISENMYRIRKHKDGTSERVNLVKHVIFYMDDILILGTNAKDIHKAMSLIIKYADKKITKDDFKYYTYRTGKLKEDRRSETKPLPEYFRQAFNFLYDISGVQTMAEVAIGGGARYIIHYGDNEVWALKGMTDIGSEIPSYRKNDKEYVEKYDTENKVDSESED